MEILKLGKQEKKPKNADTLDAKSNNWVRTFVDLEKNLNNTDIKKITFKKLIDEEVVLEAKPDLLMFTLIMQSHFTNKMFQILLRKKHQQRTLLKNQKMKLLKKKQILKKLIKNFLP